MNPKLLRAGYHTGVWYPARRMGFLKYKAQASNNSTISPSIQAKKLPQDKNPPPATMIVLSDIPLCINQLGYLIMMGKQSQALLYSFFGNP